VEVDCVFVDVVVVVREVDGVVVAPPPQMTEGEAGLEERDERKRCVTMDLGRAVAVAAAAVVAETVGVGGVGFVAENVVEFAVAEY
jgi:hypothetical protein